MLHTEYDNKLNEDLQGNGKDDGKEFIKMKVVGQDNSEVHFKVKMIDKIPETRTLLAFRDFVKNEPLWSLDIRLVKI